MKRSLTIILAVLLVAMSLTACSIEDFFGPKLTINVPEETIQAELGSYDLPKYDVVDENNLIDSTYKVVVKKVVDPDGNEVKVAYNKINATVPGIYTITYGVEEGNVKDAELKVDFADRTAPTLDIAEDALPKYYIQSMQYQLPAYSLVGDPDFEASYIKVFYIATPDGEKTEVTVTDSIFTVEHNTGIYQILIHAEDAAGNAKEYTFNVEATGPSEVVEGKILYSDEAFGASQLSFLWNVWSMEYSTEMAWGEEAGSIKVSAPSGATDYLILSKLIQKDVTAYDKLVVRIYNANDYAVYTGCTWFGDTALAPNAWTEVTFSLKDVNAMGSHPAVVGLKPTSENLENLTLRFWDDYSTNTVTAGSEFYISAMYAVKNEVVDTEPTEGLVSRLDGSLNPFQGSSNVSYVTDVKYGEENGSLKITANATGEHYVSVLSPDITDVSAYDHLVFRVYTDKEITAGVLWWADTVCKAGEWTEIKVSVADIVAGKITDFGAALPATNITGISLRIFTGLEVGESVYVSHIYAIEKENTEPAPEPEVESVLISKLDSTAGLNPFNGCAGVEYVTDTKYGEEEGSLKITANATAEMYIAITNPETKDVSAYNYVAFKVYNPTEHDITVGTMWSSDTVCRAGEWTEVKVAASEFAAGKVDAISGADVLMSDVTGFSVRIVGTMAVGEVIYVSHVYAGM